MKFLNGFKTWLGLGGGAADDNVPVQRRDLAGSVADSRRRGGRLMTANFRRHYPERQDVRRPAPAPRHPWDHRLVRILADEIEAREISRPEARPKVSSADERTKLHQAGADHKGCGDLDVAGVPKKPRP